MFSIEGVREAISGDAAVIKRMVGADNVKPVEFSEKNDYRPGLFTEPAADVKNALRAADEIIFRNNDVLTGRIVTEKIRLRTEHGEIGFKTCDLVSLYFVYEANPPYDKAVSVNGDKISGKVITEALALMVSSGDTVAVSTSKVKMINFKRR